MWLRSGSFIGPAAASGLKPHRRFPSLDLRTFHFSCPLFLQATSHPLPKEHSTGPPQMREMKLQDLKSKTPAELVPFAEENRVANAITMRKQQRMFAILNQLAIHEIHIINHV